MDVDEAIKAHATWKLDLAVHLRNNGTLIDPAGVRPDTLCKLGQWLHGEGKQFSSLVEYRTLLDEHARFHRAAAGVVERANAGRDIREEQALAWNSEFSSSSRAVVTAIMALKNQIDKQRPKERIRPSNSGVG